MFRGGGTAISVSSVAFLKTMTFTTHLLVAQASCAGWNLATEFRLSPNQANPNPDNCAVTPTSGPSWKAALLFAIP